MADKKDKTYGSITKAADTKKQQGKMPPDTDFSKNIKVAQNTIRNRVEETGEKIETSDSVQNIGKSFSDAVRGMTQAVGQSAVDQRKVLAKIVSQNKTAGGGGLNPKEMAKILAAANAKQAKQTIPKKIPGLAKGGFVSKTGLAKIHTGESVFPKGSLEELVSLMKEQVYHIKQISGFYDDVKIPDMLKTDDKTFGRMFKDWIKDGLYSAFPTFIKIGKAIGKPFYKLFRVRGGTYVYATHLSKAESPFRQISENIGILYTGSMLHMDRMINIQKATAEAVRDLSTHVTGKAYPAIEDIKPSKKWRAITAIAKGVGKGILGLGGAALGGMAGMAMGGPLGAIAGAAGGGMFGYQKGGSMLKGMGKGMGKAYWRSAQNKSIITKEETERFAQWKKEKKEDLKFWTKEARAARAEKKKRKREEDLSDFGDFKPGSLRAAAKEVPGLKKGGRVKKTGIAKVHEGEIVIPKEKGSNIKCPPIEISSKGMKNLSKATSLQPLGIKFAKVKSKFSKKNKDNVIDIALNPESQKALDQIRDTSKQAADSTKNMTGEGKGDSIFSTIMGGLLSLAGTIGGLLFNFLLNTDIGKVILAGAAGYGIGTLINRYLIEPFFKEKERRDDKDRATTAAKAAEAAKAASPKVYRDLVNNPENTNNPEELVKKLREADFIRQSTLTSGTLQASLEDKRSIAAKWRTGPFFVSDVLAKTHEYMRDHIDEYRGYDPMEIEKLKETYNRDNPLGGFWQTDPGEVAKEREEKFRNFVKKKLKKKEPGQYSDRDIQFIEAQEAKSNANIKSVKDSATNNLIKLAKENAVKILTDTYGIPAGEAQRYVDTVIKDLERTDPRALTDSTILEKTARAYMEKETGKPIGEKARSGAPSDYGKTSAINEANQAALTANAVEEGVTKGMKPAMAEQAKNLSAAITATSNSGIATNNLANTSNSTSSSNSNYVYPGAVDVWTEQAQRGAFAR